MIVNVRNKRGAAFACHASEYSVDPQIQYKEAEPVGSRMQNLRQIEVISFYHDGTLKLPGDSKLFGGSCSSIQK